MCKIWRNLSQKSRFSPDLRSFTPQIHPPRSMIKHLIVHITMEDVFPLQQEIPSSIRNPFPLNRPVGLPGTWKRSHVRQVRFLIGEFPTLFGTELGERLQRWARSAVFAWNLKTEMDLTLVVIYEERRNFSLYKYNTYIEV